jgi:hypothetical protein
MVYPQHLDYFICVRVRACVCEWKQVFSYTKILSNYSVPACPVSLAH